jgi:hypothetical protein
MLRLAANATYNMTALIFPPMRKAIGYSADPARFDTSGTFPIMCRFSRAAIRADLHAWIVSCVISMAFAARHAAPNALAVFPFVTKIPTDKSHCKTSLSLILYRQGTTMTLHLSYTQDILMP